MLSRPFRHPRVAGIDFVSSSRRAGWWRKTPSARRYHRNVMSEFMGLIEGTYDAKEEGFAPAAAACTIA